jgi:hypothetical protein
MLPAAVCCGSVVDVKNGIVMSVSISQQNSYPGAAVVIIVFCCENTDHSHFK